jgi:hypothetical protein
METTLAGSIDRTVFAPFGLFRETLARGEGTILSFGTG